MYSAYMPQTYSLYLFKDILKDILAIMNMAQTSSIYKDMLKDNNVDGGDSETQGVPRLPLKINKIYYSQDIHLAQTLYTWHYL